ILPVFFSSCLAAPHDLPSFPTRRSSDLSQETLRFAASAEQYSVHVYAEPIVTHSRQQQLDFIAIAEAQEVATNGVEATTATGDRLRVGKASFIAEVVPSFAEVALSAGETAVYVSHKAELIGVIVLADPLRETSTATLNWLSDQGVDQMI